MPSIAVDRRLLIRAGIALVAVLVLGGSAAAFAYTQTLKLGRAPMVPTEGFARLLAPTCACPTAQAELVFLVRKRDTATVRIVDGGGEPVRTLAEARDVRRGRVTFTWDGRDDAGRVVADGPYRVLLRLAEADRTVLVPTTVRVDTVAPEGAVTRVGPTTISPNADGRNDSVKVRYRSSARARAILLVDGRQVVATPRRKQARRRSTGRAGSTAGAPRRARTR
ncbi:MAG: FlgD immunoglobulin-like domain containing protein [Thermoleophilia bacterium]